MPLELRLGTADVAGLRFARSPLWETMEALRTLGDPRRQAFHLFWLRSVDRAAVAAAARELAPLIPTPGYTPDFLIPIPTGPTTTVDDDLATVAATPLQVVERELRICLTSSRAAPHVAVAVRALLADPAATLRRVVAAQRTCWDHLVRPYWAAVDDLLADDIAHRAAVLAGAGLATALDGLHANLSWTDGVLRFGGTAHGFTDDVRGRGLVLMPSVFAWPNVIAVTDPPWQPTVIYPARGVGTLWPPGPARPAGALGELLGTSRARLLAELAVEASTSTLARRLGLGLPTTSVHLRVLRAAGLVTARRAGREVLHRRTALGATLGGW
ncbi:ArsR/SmtB family transcription factor [Pseudonocardia sp. GCM10023141]|uniref:ArsR/SmtB family transcription factor n=1 Tax=Pseudonocardia sp. GCM10023141 TaxID=3252653 RepID=UPI003621F70C